LASPRACLGFPGSPLRVDERCAQAFPRTAPHGSFAPAPARTGWAARGGGVEGLPAPGGRHAAPPGSRRSSSPAAGGAIRGLGEWPVVGITGLGTWAGPGRAGTNK